MLGPGIYSPEGLMGTGQTALGMAETEVLWFRGRGCPKHAVDHAPERGLPRCTLAWGLQGLPARSLEDWYYGMWWVSEESSPEMQR